MTDQLTMHRLNKSVPESVGPLTKIADAVGCCEPGGKPSPHRISVLKAVRMCTQWSAYGAGEESDEGRISADAGHTLLSWNVIHSQYRLPR